jgi:succinoglycan biosynthesis transport protein ExoP
MEDDIRLARRERPWDEPLTPIAVQQPGTNWGPSSREAHLMDYVLILRKHVWLSIAFLLTVVSVVAIATFKMRPVYVATARLEIDRESTNMLPFQGETSDDMFLDMENYIETQSRILQSETLALQTIQILELWKNPEFASDPGDLELIKPGSTGPLKRPAILGAFLGHMSVKRIPNTHLLEVQFESFSPQLAAIMANTHLKNYIENNYRTRYESTTQASNWLAEQMNDFKNKVEKSEDARITYERQNQIWTIDEKQDITTQKLSDLNKELTQAQADRMRKEADYAMVRAGDLDALAASRDSTVLRDLIAKQADLNQQYTEALNQFGPNYPKVQRLQAELKEMGKAIAHEHESVAKQVEVEYDGARKRESLLDQALSQQKAAANQVAEKLVQYNILKREAETNKQLYDGLLQKLKEAGISAGLRSSNIRVMDPALIPPYPSRPQKTRNITLAFIVGLIGGLGLGFFREYLDNTVKTPDDVEFLSRLPSLAVVPALISMNGHNRQQRLLKGAQDNGDATRVELVSHERPQSQIAEAFRALRTSLLLSRAGQPPQIILVTSALPKEGKTTAAVNLAVTLAQLGDRTLLVDADLRKPGIAKLLDMVDKKRLGLSSYLAGVSSLEQITYRHPLIPDLAVVPSGPIPPNPADLLSSQRLLDAISQVRHEYKFVVIDSPPIMAATDAVILSTWADGVLLVVRSGETPKGAFSRARDLLGGVKCRLLGVVLNAVDTSSPDYYYSYKYYPYHYGGYGLDEAARQKAESESTEN